MSQYYYTDGKERFGPFTLDQLKEKGITGSTLVWKEGLTDWVPAGQMMELNSLFGGETHLPPVAAYQSPLPMAPPKNWLIESILVTIFCCLPLGIVGIIFATKVDTFWKTGQYDAAVKASQDAGRWVKLGAIIGAVVIVLYFILVFFGVMAGLSAGMEV
jgi:hypothetical protein